MAKKIQQFYIIKLNANKIIYNNLNLNINLHEARKNDECIAVGDSQVLRTIRKLTNKEFVDADLLTLLKQKIKLSNKIKKGVDLKQNKSALFEVLREIDQKLFIPEFISVVSDKTSEYNKLAKKGFIVNGIKYLPFMCSAGNARMNIAFFISQSIYKQANLILQNGFTNIEICYAKYNAYFSLVSSATFVVSNPNVCVVKDYEVNREFMVDWVNRDTNINPRVTEQLKALPFNLWDGMGLISPAQAKKWANELELDYTPCGFCIRNVFIKGMVFTFDFHKFAYKCANTRKITDIWGTEHHIDEIEVILTQSQFKLWNAYSSWKQYAINLTKNELSWGVSKYSPKQEKDSVRTNYQFLQVLDLKENDVKELCKSTIDWLTGVVGKDINYIKLYLLGKLTKFENINDIWNNIQDPMIKALLINDDVSNDKYISNKIIQSINKKIKESYYGKLITNGNFQFMISDPYAFCEHVFGMEVKGLLGQNQFYSNYWNNKEVDLVAGLRSPLTWRSEINKLPLLKNEQTEEWYKYLNSGIVINVFGDDVLKFAGSD